MPKFETGIARGKPFRETQFTAIEFSKKKNIKRRPLKWQDKEWIGKIKSETNDYLAFLEKNLFYPLESFYNEIQGIVLVEIYANKKGKQNFKIEHGIDPACDNEALRLVKLMPQYQTDVWEKEMNKETQYVPILFSVYAYELWRNQGNRKD